MTTILVGVDGSESSRRALEVALREAALRDGATVRMVYASPPVEVPAMVAARSGAALLGPSSAERRETGEGILEESLAGVSVPDGVKVEREVALSEAAAALVERSGEADMLVVGSRGLGGFRGLLLGSVSQQCVSHARCPVIVVPPAAEG